MAFRLSTGLRHALLGRGSYPAKLVTGTTFAFEDGTGTGGTDRITDSGNGFVAAGYVVGDVISVAGSTSNNVSGKKVSAVAAGYLEIPAASLATEVAGDQVIIGAGAGGGSWDEIFKNCVIEIYSGAQPADADTAESGTKLARITVASGAFTPGAATNGLNFDETAIAAGVLSKPSGTVWSGVGLAAGTAGWFRCYANDYVTGSSTSGLRFDGSVGTSSSSAQLVLPSVSVALNQTITVDTGTLTQPAA